MLAEPLSTIGVERPDSVSMSGMAVASVEAHLRSVDAEDCIVWALNICRAERGTSRKEAIVVKFWFRDDGTRKGYFRRARWDTTVQLRLSQTQALGNFLRVGGSKIPTLGESGVCASSSKLAAAPWLRRPSSSPYCTSVLYQLAMGHDYNLDFA